MNNFKYKLLYIFIVIISSIFANSIGYSSIKNLNSPHQSLISTKDNLKSNEPEKLQEHFYLLGIGDRIFLKVIGAEELSTEIKILNDGNATIPLVGVKRISGYTIEGASKVIESALSKELINPKVELTLIEARPITVSIIGEVTRPGVYKLASNNNDLPSLISIIEKAGGLSKKADLSKIKLKRRIANKGMKYKQANVNLKRLILDGDFQQNPYLFDGDVIYVKKSELPDKDLLAIASSTLSPKKIRVNFLGEITRPGSIDLKPNTTLLDGILAAGGPKDWRSNYSFVEILRINSNGTGFRKRYKINLSNNYSEKNNPILNNGDSVWIRKNNFAKATDTLGNVASPIRDLVSIWTLFRLVD